MVRLYRCTATGEYFDSLLNCKLCCIRNREDPYFCYYCPLREEVDLIREKFARIGWVLDSLKELDFKAALYFITEPFIRPLFEKLGRSITLVYTSGKTEIRLI